MPSRNHKVGPTIQTKRQKDVGVLFDSCILSHEDGTEDSEKGIRYRLKNLFYSIVVVVVVTH